MPFAQAIGDNHPNRIGEQFYKLTLSPSRAAAAGVSYDFGDPAPILNPFKNGNFVPHVLQKSRFLFCVDSGDFRIWKVCLGTLPWPRESVLGTLSSAQGYGHPAQQTHPSGKFMVGIHSWWPKAQMCKLTFSPSRWGGEIVSLTSWGWKVCLGTLSWPRESVPRHTFQRPRLWSSSPENASFWEVYGWLLLLAAQSPNL